MQHNHQLAMLTLYAARHSHAIKKALCAQILAHVKVQGRADEQSQHAARWNVCCQRTGNMYTLISKVRGAYHPRGQSGT